MTKINFGFVAAALFVLSSCGATPQRQKNRIERVTVPETAVAEHQKLVGEGDALWANRGDRASLESALQKWEAAVKLKDDDHESYAKLARGYYFLADAYLAFDAMGGGYPYDPDGVKDATANEAFLNMHLRGIEHAERGMAASSPDFEKRIMQGIQPEDAVELIGRNGVPLVYWYASNLGKWAKAKGFSTVLKHKDRIFKMASHVYKTGPDYFFGASDRYFGAFYAVAPAFAGGDLDKSEQHFGAAFKAGPEYLGSYVLAAELWATKAQNPAAFDEYLAKVTSSTEGPVEIAPENAVEKRKAAALIAKKADLF